MSSPIIPIELLHQLLRYEPETGKLFWRERSVELFTQDGNVYPAERKAACWNAKNAGKEAFTAYTAKGYRQGRILSQTMLAHRLIMAMVSGIWPEDQVDHINGVRDDNRAQNLRCVSNRENHRNQKRYSTNTSGASGVRWCKKRKKWSASISAHEGLVFLGAYENIEDAIAARKGAEIEHCYHPNHDRAAVD